MLYYTILYAPGTNFVVSRLEAEDLVANEGEKEKQQEMEAFKEEQAADADELDGETWIWLSDPNPEPTLDRSWHCTPPI